MLWRVQWQALQEVEPGLFIVLKVYGKSGCILEKKTTDGRVFRCTPWCANTAIDAIFNTFCVWQHTFEVFFLPDTNTLCLATHV